MGSRTFYEVADQRRSTRVFTEAPVEREVVERIVGAARFAPTACNRQLWHFVVVTDPAMKVRISKLSHAEQSYLYDAPTLICVFYDCTLEDRNRCQTPFIGAGMAIYALLLATEAEGLGGIYLGGIRRPSGVAKAVGAPSYLTNLGLIAVGHKAEDGPMPPRRDVSDIISYNTCDLREKHYHADIRPHLWSLSQIADFRAKLTWYKGVHIDGKTLHVDPDTRFSEKYRVIAGTAGMMISKYEKPRVLDILSLNGALILQLLNTCGEDLEKIYAYELDPGILEYMKTRFQRIVPDDKVEGLLNEDAKEVHIPLPDDHVDVITCYERLEHFHDPSDLLSEMQRVLKPGGRALVVISNRFYPHMYRYRRMHKNNYSLGRNWNRGPEQKYEPRQIRTHFRNAGFRVESTTGLQPLEQKFYALAEKVFRRFNMHERADCAADRRAQAYCSHSFTKNFSSSIAYELSKS